MNRPVLIIQLAKLGDFIQSTSLLAKIRQHCPGAPIVLAAAQPSVQQAASLSPLVDMVVETGPAPSGQIQLKSLEPFAAIFVLNSHPEAAALAVGLKNETYFGPRLTDGELIFTPAQRFLMAVMAECRSLGRFNLVDVWASLLPGAPSPATVWPTMAAVTNRNYLPNKIRRIGFQLSSRNHLRRWPVERFAEFSDVLSMTLEHGWTPVLLGSAEEKAFGRRFEKLTNVTAENLIGCTDLKTLGDAVSGLDLLLTGDTGVMHLAAAVNTPVLSLFFGPAYGPETGPYGSGHIIYQAAAACAPCRESSDCRRRQCLEMPDAEIAASLAAAMLQGGSHLLTNDLLAAMPPCHRVWSTVKDEFGQNLKPLARPHLTPDETLALILTEAGRGVINSGYQPEAKNLVDIFTAYDDVSQVLSVNVSQLKRLTDNAFGEASRQGTNFLKMMVELAENFGVKIA